jgi:hypothetical protein
VTLPIIDVLLLTASSSPEIGQSSGPSLFQRLSFSSKIKKKKIIDNRMIQPQGFFVMKNFHNVSLIPYSKKEYLIQVSKKIFAFSEEQILILSVSAYQFFKSTLLFSIFILPIK